MDIKLKVISDSYFKQNLLQAVKNTPDNLAFVKANQDYIVTSIYIAPDNHFQIKLATPIDSKVTWYVFQPHVQLLGLDDKILTVNYRDIPNLDTTSPQTGSLQNPDSPPEEATDTVDILGAGKVSLASSIISKGSFTWSEATHGGTRLPQEKSHTYNIIRLATMLQPQRNKVGKSFHITSWYRPEPFNSAAGGASNSFHLYGGAVDFWIDGMSKHQMYDYFNPIWDGGLGIYAHNDIIHLDSGSRARWL